MAPQLHIFLLPFIAPGHINPMVDFAMILANRGVRATVLATPSTAGQILRVMENAQHSSLPIDLLPIRFPSSEAGIPDNHDSLTCFPSPQIPAKIFTALELLCQSLPHVLNQQPRLPDCIVFDNYLPWTADVANSLNIPSLVFQTIGYFPLCIYHSLQDVTLGDDEDVVIVPGLPHRVQMKRSQLPSSVLARNEFSRFMELMVEAEVKSRGAVVNTFYDMEPAYADHYRDVVRRTAWHVGPVSLINHVGAQEMQPNHELVMSWLDAHPPASVVYVCFGSLGRLTTVQMGQIGLGLEGSEHPFLWVVRDGEAEGWEVKGKGMVVRGWVPQVRILNHVAVGGFVTHCGWNSFMEAVSAGVPLVMWPMFAEQFYTEELVVGVLGIGLRVGADVWGMVEEGKPVLTGLEIARALRRLMDSSEKGDGMRQRVAKLGMKARMAVENGGSSYDNLSHLIDEISKWTKC